jgi:hypothetical protein
MTATTASTARKATSPKRLLALVLAFAAAVALAVSVAPAAAYAADPIVIDVTRSHETVAVGDYVTFKVEVTNVGDETLREIRYTSRFEGEPLDHYAISVFNPGDSFTREYVVSPAEVPEDGTASIQAMVQVSDERAYGSGWWVTVIPSIADCDIVFEDQAYTGSEVTPIPTVTLNGRELEYGTDFFVGGYEGNVEAGEARAWVCGKYTVVGGATWRTFNIVPPHLHAHLAGRTGRRAVHPDLRHGRGQALLRGRGAREGF